MDKLIFTLIFLLFAEITSAAYVDKVTVSGTTPVSATSWPLPAGAATSVKQDTSNTWLSDIDGYISATFDVNLGSRATESTLSSINSKIPNLGQALAVSSTPVVLTASQLSTLTPLSTVTANIGTTNGLGLDSSLTTLNTSVNSLLKPASTLTKVTTVDTITNAVTVNTHAVKLLDNSSNAIVTGQTASSTSAVGYLNTIAGGVYSTPYPTLNSGSISPLLMNQNGAITVDLTNTRSNSSPILIAGSVNGSVQSVSMTTAGAVRIDLGATTQNATPLVVSSTGTVPVSVAAGITANAGTNLNTSLLALESGGNLATIKTNTDPLIYAQGSTTSGQVGNLGLTATTAGAPTYVTAKTNPLSTDTLGNLRVVSTPSGTTTVSVSNIPHVIADTGSTTAVTGNVTVVQSTNSSLKADVTSNAANIATEASLAKLTQTQGSTTSGQSGPLVQAAVTTGAPSYTTAQTSPLSQDTAGNLRVAATVSGTPSVNVAQANGVTMLMGNGATGTGSIRVTIANDSTGIGTVTETAPASDTASSGLNGRLQRIAQNLTTMNTTPLVAGTNIIGKVGIDQTTPGTTNLVALAANQSVNISQMNGVTTSMGIGPVGTGTLRVNQANIAAATLSNVSSSSTSVTLQASNANRVGLNIFNDSTAILYVKFGATASVTSYTLQIAPGGYYEMSMPIYSGIVDGIWSAANGNARMTEF